MKSSDYTEYAAEVIFTDCSGQDIRLAKSLISVTFENGTSQNLETIPWPEYDEEILAEVIAVLSSYEPYNECGAIITQSNRLDGCGLLKCGNNTLNSNGYEFLWNGYLIDAPTTETHINTAVNNQGNLIQGDNIYNPIQEQTKLDECILQLNMTETNLNQTIMNYTTYKNDATLASWVTGLVIAIVGSAVFYLVLYPKANQKRIRNCLFLLVVSIITLIIMQLFLFPD